MITKKQALTREILRRKGEKKIRDWIKSKCMGKTVKEAYDIIMSEEFCLMVNENTPPSLNPEPKERKLSDNDMKHIIEMYAIFTFQDVFKSVWAQMYIWNCAHHGYNCDYVLTEKDLVDD